MSYYERLSGLNKHASLDSRAVAGADANYQASKKERASRTAPIKQAPAKPGVMPQVPYSGPESWAAPAPLPTDQVGGSKNKKKGDGYQPDSALPFQDRPGAARYK